MNVREAAKTRNRLTTWYVESETTPGVEYIVHNKRDAVSHRKNWTCNCPDFTNRRMFSREDCKHILEVKTYLYNKEEQARILRNAQIAEQQSPAPVPNELKALLDQIVNFVNNRWNGDLLWDILSALRGPDAENSEYLKEATSAKIRHAIGLRSNHSFVTDSYPFSPEILDALRGKVSLPFDTDVRSAIKDAVQKAYPSSEYHFRAHFAKALVALKKLGYIE